LVLETTIALRRYDAGCEFSGRRELDQLKILGTIDLVVHDTWGLQARVAGAESELSLILVSEGNPPFQDIKHLKVEFMDVRPSMGEGLHRFLDPNDMSMPVAWSIPRSRYSKNVRSPGCQRASLEKLVENC